MNRIKGNFKPLVMVALGLAILFFVALGLPSLFARPAQAQTGNPMEVPNTPVPRPAPVQPLPYSHKLHLALSAKLECKGCHTNPDPAGLMTYPSTAVCMKCHNATAKDRPTIKKLAEFDKAKKEVPWVRVYKIASGVTWNHRKHLDAGIKCETCHGDVSQVETMTNIKSLNAMGGCVGCHKLQNAKLASCTTCHPAWAPGMVVVKQ